MRSGTRALCVLFLLAASCSQIIGLGDYDKVDGESGGSSGSSNGGTGGSGGTNHGGTSTGDAGGGAGGVGGVGEGGAAGTSDAGRGGSITSGGRATGGTPNGGGASGEAGAAGSGGVDTGGGGAGGEGGTSGTGGTLTGGTGGATGGKGGTGGSTGGTSGGTAGKGGSGGTTGGTSGGKGGTGGTTGGTAGKGGSGGTTGGTCSNVELIEPGGNFDTNTAAWIESVSPLICDKSCFKNPNTLTAQSSPNFAWLGGEYDVTHTLDRVINVPTGTRSVTLDCFFWTATEEAATDVFDYMDLQLVDTDGFQVALFGELDNTVEHTAWTRRTFTVQATAFTGTPARLEFLASLDGDLNTNFFIDTCSLRANVCN